MPKINLRLTDAEHDALKEWAASSHRSIQREAVYRLFNDRSLPEREQPLREADAAARVAKEPRLVSRSESDHFKGPDFK